MSTWDTQSVRRSMTCSSTEGASTLLGPEEAATIVELLADTSSGPPAARVQKETFDAGPERKSRFGPHSHPVSAPRNMLDEGLEPLMPRSLKRMESRVPQFEWTESDDEEWASDKRSVEIYSVDNQGHIEHVDTDLDFNVLTVLVDGSSSNSTVRRDVDSNRQDDIPRMVFLCGKDPGWRTVLLEASPP